MPEPTNKISGGFLQVDSLAERDFEHYVTYPPDTPINIDVRDRGGGIRLVCFREAQELCDNALKRESTPRITFLKEVRVLLTLLNFERDLIV
jgi:hypothetical protein